MARKKRSEVFVPSEVAIVHTICKVVRRCMLMGYDKVTNKNYDHRKDWIENEFKRMASYFAIDVLAFSILSNHVHQILRSRPDIVETWSDREVARRWLTLCPTVAQDKESVRKQKQAAKAMKAKLQQPTTENSEEGLAPIELKQGLDVCGADQLTRKGFLMMTCTEYIELLEWTARQIVPGKRGATPEDTPSILKRLNISPEIWCILTTSFDGLFGVAAGSPTTLDKTPGPTDRPFKLRGATRELLANVQAAC